MGSRSHVLDGGRDLQGKWQFWGSLARSKSTVSFRCGVCSESNLDSRKLLQPVSHYIVACDAVFRRKSLINCCFLKLYFCGGYFQYLMLLDERDKQHPDCSRDVAMVTNLWRKSAKIEIPHLHSLRHF